MEDREAMVVAEVNSLVFVRGLALRAIDGHGGANWAPWAVGGL